MRGGQGPAMVLVRMVSGFDPLVRLLALAVLLASLLPVTAEYRPIAQAVSNDSEISSTERTTTIHSSEAVPATVPV